MNVLVVGGGIGGLSVALALHRLGHQVTLVEAAPRLEGVGAGIILAANATHALEALGLEVMRDGVPLASMDLCLSDGAPLQRLEVKDTIGISRPALHRALHRALPASVAVELGTPVREVVDLGDAVEVRFEGAAAARRYELVVGADGLRSTVRERVLGPVALKYSGVTCLRGVVPHAPMAGALEAWGVGTRVGLVPVEGGRAYYYLVHTAPARAAAPAWPHGLRAVYAGYRGVAGAFLESLAEAPPLHHDLNELFEPVWGKGRVLLLGDAAHGMTPNQGQGAAMAIEDALGLAMAVADGASGALERYRALRHARVHQVQLDSRRLGDLAHWESAAARAIRNTVVRWLPPALGRAQLRRLWEPGLELARRYEAACQASRKAA